MKKYITLMAILTSFALQGMKAKVTFADSTIREQFEHVKKALGIGADVNERNELGETPLIQAVLLSNPAAVYLLLAHGAKIDAVDSFALDALHWALFRYRRMSGNSQLSKGKAAAKKVLELLIKHPLMSLNVLNYIDRAEFIERPLHLALLCNDHEILLWLHDAGAKLDGKSLTGRTLLEAAFVLNRPHLVIVIESLIKSAPARISQSAYL